MNGAGWCLGRGVSRACLLLAAVGRWGYHAAVAAAGSFEGILGLELAARAGEVLKGTLDRVGLDYSQ